MTEHVYIVARAGECNGVRVSVYSDALTALNSARRSAEAAGWTAQDGPLTNPGQLWMAHGAGDEDWIEVQQRPVDGHNRARVTVQSATDDRFVAEGVVRELQWQRRA